MKGSYNILNFASQDLFVGVELKLLPKTNCKKCGEPTCMVFALRVIDEVKEVEDCPDLEPVKKTKLTQYIGRFNRES